MNKQKIGKDNWLFILTNALANYVEAGGRVEVFEDEEIGAMGIYLTEVEADDTRLHPGFVKLIDWQLTALHRENALEAADE